MRPITNTTLFAFAAAMMAAPAVAAADFYLKLGDVKSRSTADGGAATQIEIMSWSWGATNAARVAKIDNFATKRQAGGGGGAPLARGSVTVNGRLPGCTVGATYPDAVLQTTYIRYELKEVLVSSCSVSGGGSGEQPTESVTLNYASYRESPTRASQK